MNPSLQLCPGVGTSARFMGSSAAGKTAPSPAEAHLNISVTSPFAKATRSGNPMQAGTRYSSAGYGEEKQLLNQTTNHPKGRVQGKLLVPSAPMVSVTWLHRELTAQKAASGVQ